MTLARLCEDCHEDISLRHAKAKRCKVCALKAHLVQMRAAHRALRKPRARPKKYRRRQTPAPTPEPAPRRAHVQSKRAPVPIQRVPDPTPAVVRVVRDGYGNILGYTTWDGRGGLTS